MDSRKETILIIMAAALVGVIGVTVMETMYYVDAKSITGACASNLKKCICGIVSEALKVIKE